MGKSLVALEICSSLVTGEPLWGQLYPTATVKRILYILGEHYDLVIQRLWQKTQLPMTDQVWLLGPEALGLDKWLVSGGRQNHTAVAKFRRWAEGVDLIVWDPLSAFILGVDAENDNLQMRLVLDTMSGIAQSAGASCLVLAHQGKPSMDRFGQEHHRKSYAIRGASAVEDAATNIFYMGPSRGRSEVASETAQDDSLFELTLRKYKGEAPARYRLQRDPERLTHTLVDAQRPFAEVRRRQMREKVDRLREAHPDWTLTAVVKELAHVEGRPESTVWGYVKG